MRSRLMMVGAVVAFVFGTPLHVNAVGRLGPAETVLGGYCLFGGITQSARDDIAPSGVADCYPNELRSFARRGPGRWSVQRLPFSGRTLASAADDSGQYFLLVSTGSELPGVILVRQNLNGSQSARRLSTSTAVTSGDVVAVDGKWWAVWSETVSGDVSELYQSHTLFSSQARTRISTGQLDMYPRIAAIPAHHRVALAWSRSTPAGASVRIGSSTGGGWTTREFAAADSNTSPAVAEQGGSLFVAWLKNKRPELSSNESGEFRTHAFVTRSCAITVDVAASSGVVHLAWTQCQDEAAPDNTIVVLAERRNGQWSSTPVSPRSADFRLGGLSSRRGAATVFFDNGIPSESGRGMARTQEN
jgi:hypothetical protein